MAEATKRSPTTCGTLVCVLHETWYEEVMWGLQLRLSSHPERRTSLRYLGQPRLINGWLWYCCSNLNAPVCLTWGKQR
ncbi:hypothetical protein KL86CLO1_20017 [uncultured Eubacteriales bacterium]|uniref:Uncharacterized protein n=1 Tax=uncultured Eubacteriales bacterium TaxID=172733 RepID=A0A212KLM4_9FIRM|nr:hypothetical protein KL86CLO1_20017 [uncultured Eubacteriales bacterium]